MDKELPRKNSLESEEFFLGNFSEDPCPVTQKFRGVNLENSLGIFPINIGKFPRNISELTRNVLGSFTME
jgi:hypothetical protein